ncbi:MAG: AraC family transcriptional regulator [Streptomycetaceae bacterium]|nr:AraC family transcriptional regulator [Streptomycetaceae bacterium]
MASARGGGRTPAGPVVPDPYVSVVRRPLLTVLAPFVRVIGYAGESGGGSFPQAAELVLPNGGLQLLVNLDRDELGSRTAGADRLTRGAALQGPQSGPVVVEPEQQRAVVWAAFHTAGAGPFAGVPLGAVRERLVGLEDLWGRGGAVLRERLLEAVAAGGPQACLRELEAALAEVAAPERAPDPAVRMAAARLDRGVSVAEAADGIGWTTRRLSAGFATQVGLSPKRYARIRRFQRLLARVNGDPESPDWALLAAEVGYHDQAHLIHEFRALAGMTPTAYAPRSAAALNHVPLLG